MSGHDRPEQAVTFKRNGRSRWAGICIQTLTQRKLISPGMQVHLKQGRLQMYERTFQSRSYWKILEFQPLLQQAAISTPFRRHNFNVSQTDNFSGPHVEAFFFQEVRLDLVFLSCFSLELQDDPARYAPGGS